MRALFSNAGVLPRLRHLQTGRDLEDDDSSLLCLIEFAQNTPALEEIVLTNCVLSGGGVTQLAAAGSDERWPRLELLSFGTFVGTHVIFYYSVLRVVWPDLAIEYGPGE